MILLVLFDNQVKFDHTLFRVKKHLEIGGYCAEWAGFACPLGPELKKPDKLFVHPVNDLKIAGNKAAEKT
ncbi:MAG: hypothetical protein ACU83V_12690 [Gammaproteobacteria bacterium]